MSLSGPFVLYCTLTCNSSKIYSYTKVDIIQESIPSPKRKISLKMCDKYFVKWIFPNFNNLYTVSSRETPPILVLLTNLPETSWPGHKDNLNEWIPTNLKTES